MNKSTLTGLLALTATAALTFGLITVHKTDREKQALQAQIRLRDDFIREHLDTLYRLKDEFVLNRSNESAIHNLDSLGLRFAKESNSLDYYRYALDINYLQEQLRKQD